MENLQELQKKLQEKEQKIRELSLKTEELSDFIENASVPLHWVDKDGLIVWANQAELDFLGYSSDEYIGRSISDFHADKEVIADVLTRLKNGETLLNYPARLVTKDGVIKNVIINSNVLVKDGEFIHTRCFTRDITEQKNFTTELEQKVLERTIELKQSRAFLQSVLNTTKNIITSYEAVYDKDKKISDFKIVYCNDEMLAYTNMSQQEIIGKTCKEVFPSIFSNGVFERLVKCVTTGEPDKYEVKSVKNIEPIWFEASIIRLNNNGVTVTATNITEEKNAELKLENLNKQLAFQNELFRHAEESSGQGNYSWNLDTAESTYSDNFFKLLGYEPREFTILQNHFNNHIHPDDLDYVMKQIQQVIESQEVNEWEFRMITKSGESFYTKSTGMIIKTSGERLLVGTIQDISKEKKAALQLEQMNIDLEKQNEELASFSYIASHDLQEPLRKIMTFSSRLKDKYKSHLPEEAQTYLGKIDESAKRMAKLILDLLEYSRLHNEENLFVKTDLTEVVKNVLTDFELVIEQRKAVVQYGKMLAIDVIPLHINQLFYNLLSNSLKFSKTDVTPVINISTHVLTPEDIKKYPNLNMPLPYCEIVIQDNGIGFEQKYDQQIFVIFQRLNRRDEYDGTGIGLSICKKIVDNHRGIIFVESNLNEGSTFHIILPIHQPT